jgi:hypothetical protein
MESVQGPICIEDMCCFVEQIGRLVLVPGPGEFSDHRLLGCQQVLITKASRSPEG